MTVRTFVLPVVLGCAAADPKDDVTDDTAVDDAPTADPGTGDTHAMHTGETAAPATLPRFQPAVEVPYARVAVLTNGVMLLDEHRWRLDVVAGTAIQLGTDVYRRPRLLDADGDRALIRGWQDGVLPARVELTRLTADAPRPIIDLSSPNSPFPEVWSGDIAGDEVCAGANVGLARFDMAAPRDQAYRYLGHATLPADGEVFLHADACWFQADHVRRLARWDDTGVHYEEGVRSLAAQFGRGDDHFAWVAFDAAAYGRLHWTTYGPDGEELRRAQHDLVATPVWVLPTANATYVGARTATGVLYVLADRAGGDLVVVDRLTASTQTAPVRWRDRWWLAGGASVADPTAPTRHQILGLSDDPLDPRRHTLPHRCRAVGATSDAVALVCTTLGSPAGTVLGVWADDRYETVFAPPDAIELDDPVSVADDALLVRTEDDTQWLLRPELP